jgi:hypothetical protein
MKADTTPPPDTLPCPTLSRPVPPEKPKGRIRWKRSPHPFYRFLGKYILADGTERLIHAVEFADIRSQADFYGVEMEEVEPNSPL